MTNLVSRLFRLEDGDLTLIRSRADVCDLDARVAADVTEAVLSVLRDRAMALEVTVGLYISGGCLQYARASIPLRVDLVDNDCRDDADDERGRVMDETLVRIGALPYSII